MACSSASCAALYAASLCTASCWAAFSAASFRGLEFCLSRLPAVPLSPWPAAPQVARPGEPLLCCLLGCLARCLFGGFLCGLLCSLTGCLFRCSLRCFLRGLLRRQFCCTASSFFGGLPRFLLCGSLCGFQRGLLCCQFRCLARCCFRRLARFLLCCLACRCFAGFARGFLSAASRATCWAASCAACCAANLRDVRCFCCLGLPRPYAASQPRVPTRPGFEFPQDLRLRLTAAPEPALLLWPAAPATALFPGSAPATPKSHGTWRHADWPRNRVSPHPQASHSGRTAASISHPSPQDLPLSLPISRTCQCI